MTLTRIRRTIGLLAVERSAMRDFWDERARENALYFVDNRLDYRAPDEEGFWAAGEADLDHLLSTVDVQLRPGDEVVEVGCGVGRLTRVIAARARHVRALDVSPRMLELARQAHPGLDNVEWMLGDGATLAGVEDASADALVSFVVFHHLPDPRVTLGYVTEMGRVLRPGGWAAFHISNDPGMHRPRGLRERVKTRLRALARRGPGGQTHAAWLGSAVDLDELRATARDAGLALERVAGAGTHSCFVLARRQGGHSP
jgi:SAM-dependent methyltransferase